MLDNQAHEGLQPPSNPEERKGLKEAEYAAHLHSAAHPTPSNLQGDLHLAPGLPAETLDHAPRLYLARG